MDEPSPPEAEKSQDVELVVTESNNNTSDLIIGEPESDKFDIAASIIYSHNYFKRVEGTETAICLTCQKYNEEIGSKGTKRRDTFSVAGSSTSGNNFKILIKSSHANF